MGDPHNSPEPTNHRSPFQENQSEQWLTLNWNLWTPISQLLSRFFSLLTMTSIQILTALSAMVNPTTPEKIPGAFYFPDAQPRENGSVRGSPREWEFKPLARVKSVNICFITHQQTINHPRTRNVRARISNTQIHNWLGLRWVKRCLGTARQVLTIAWQTTCTQPPGF